jgi:hypothetical protein
MIVENESGITGAIAKQLRQDAKLSQKNFWAPFGKTQSNGHFYEEKGRPIPKAHRMLIFAVYVLGLKLDLTTPEGVERARYLVKAQKRSDAEFELAQRERAAKSAKNHLAKVRQDA